MKKFLFNANAGYMNAGLLLLRLALGISVIWFHGFSKISNPDNWTNIGSNLSVIGINFAPKFWGFMAAFAEFFGSVFLILGLFSRLSCLLLAFTMFIAFYSNYAEGNINAYPLDLMIVFLCLLIIGPGRFSIDAQINGFKK